MEQLLTAITDYLINQSLQLSMLFAILICACWILRNASAHVRYLLWGVFLAKCLIPPLYGIVLPVLPEQAVAAAPIVSDQPEAAATPSYMLRETTPLPSESLSHAAPALAVETKRINLTAREWLGLIWAFGATFFLSYVVRKGWRIHTRLRSARRPAESSLREEIASLRHTLGTKRFPRIWTVPDISQPFVWGVWRGDIYVPEDFSQIGDFEDRRSILMHELGHVRRFDAAVNVAQVVIQSLYFFHPLVWWASARLRHEREKSCDEWVVARLKTQPGQYSEAIINSLAQAVEPSLPSSALAIAGPVKKVENRINTLMSPERVFQSRPTWKAVVVVSIAAALIVPAAFVLAAQKEKQDRPASKPGRTLRFPEDRSLGAISIRDVGDHEYHSSDWESYGLALGTVEIPEGKEVYLRVSRDGAKDLSPLTQLHPDDLVFLSCYNLPVSDDELRSIAHLTGLNALDLMMTGISDQALIHLKNLNSLEFLSLGFNRIKGKEFGCLGEMKSLKTLNLSGNREITDKGLANLPHFPALETLDLYYSKITDAGLEQIAGLTTLKRLDLTSTQTTNDGLVHLRSIKSLEELRITGKGPSSGLANLKPFQSLKSLKLDTTERGGGDHNTLRYLKDLGSLENVDLPNRMGEQGIKRLSEFSSLKTIRGITDDQVLIRLADMPNLRGVESIGLSSELVTDDGMSCLTRLPNLKQLDIQQCPVTNQGLENVVDLQSLESLQLYKTDIDTDGLAQVADLPALKTLLLTSIRLGDTRLAPLAKFENLENLSLETEDFLSDDDLESVARLTNLKWLALSAEVITDAGAARLAALESLEELALTHANLTDASLATLSQLKNLTSLTVNGDFSDEGLERLSPLRRLKYLTITGSQFSPAAVSQLQKSLPLVYLSIETGDSQR